ncbi:MAG: hypothetical protein AUG74_18175 [Bacteroidetes bacterium 13_1_20CM_4_60_6]|nr:MAG: hypothetical protein AUG74_18175 [Bacteroidetes bacterium 13_1_20CM_4_60_6]
MIEGGSVLATWAEFAHDDPDLAERARALLYRSGSGEALLATVRGETPPRIHPIAVAVIDDGLYAFILPSPKLTDLEGDGRFALHSYPDPRVPHELQIRGRVRRVDPNKQAALAKTWPFDVGSSPAFEFLIENLVIGVRADRQSWPPRYSSWPRRRNLS